MASTKKSAFQIIRRPLITEKAATQRGTIKGGEQGRGVVFEVHPRANKREIKLAIEKIFEVKVDAVRTVNYRTKPRKVKNVEVREKLWKKAYVSLAPGSSLDVIEGL